MTRSQQVCERSCRFITTPVDRQQRRASKLVVHDGTERLKSKQRMHCYYSNLIEGQQTRVRDIETALHKNFAAEPAKRDLQRLALAHLEVQRWAAIQTGPVHSAEFFRELHRRFYAA